ncbi:hypothetical protein A3A71_03850 [Candidatus Berkelbacteria bacterium RIFCSPLOWO2_01_FULL_50_28]|uniref:AAA+ ATPase domain-containing protein n=1 Tax=Candidatus Berkelbacteria bacterium RIFCSPLOWO2_01_FULL_50_28 TaxID=1797471 RepID=A0A1F5EAA9_9BACT|nr:MAG: hypothetical protein A3F39_01215 [Candidatus Berkelbacteria bacterium RIFCSPHIGHO2_12_FULL_50_11]OGD64281.1 MAG: hypothetical protein A3A71_03850 [Candidatus Berkelbacteria bacterium RIFCSPLOWO2_01_FULL_50_28]
MALAKIRSAVVSGISATAVEVEVDVASGLPGFIIVGLADKAVEESRERVRSAIKHSGFSFPLSRITVHLAPSEKKKSGVHFDLPIALAILVADGQLKTKTLPTNALFLGGLSLDGRTQAINGTLVLVEWARNNGFDRVVLPSENYEESLLVEGIDLVPVSSLNEVAELILHDTLPPKPTPSLRHAEEDHSTDWLQIQGQEKAKRAAVISAAGGHNLLMEGPPGAGKTLIARGIRALLPALNRDEKIEVVKVHSVAGELDRSAPVDSIGRPFRSPHHTASHISIVGGGTHPRPGEISLAHHGVLFLDELPEFNRLVTESLRQPLEDAEINVARVNESVRYPANFMLVATMNPCPCGWFGSATHECICSAHAISQYRKKISGPIMDRIDIYLNVPALPIAKLQNPESHSKELQTLRQLIAQAQDLARQRNGKVLNGRISPASISKICQTDPAAAKLIEQAGDKFGLTGRGYHKLLRVARTIADLNHHENIGVSEAAEALQYRFNRAS